MIMMNRDHITSMIEKEVVAGIRYLCRCQRSNGSICDPNSTSFDIWETINAVIAIYEWPDLVVQQVKSVCHTAMEFLQKCETSSGFMVHGQYLLGECCMETSAEYFRLLFFDGNHKSQRVCKFIEKIIEMQHPEGLWDICNPEVSKLLRFYSSATAYAMRAIELYGYRGKYTKAALESLCSMQDSSGHWGMPWEYYGTPYYAMAPILEVLAKHVYHKNVQQTIEKAKSFLTTSQDTQGYWFIQQNKSHRQPSAELQTALALLSIDSCYSPCVNAAYESGVKWLLTKQLPNGSWNGGIFPHPDRSRSKREDIYTTALVLCTMSKYLYFAAQDQNS